MVRKSNGGRRGGSDFIVKTTEKNCYAHGLGRIMATATHKLATAKDGGGTPSVNLGEIRAAGEEDQKSQNAPAQESEGGLRSSPSKEALGLSKNPSSHP